MRRRSSSATSATARIGQRAVRRGQRRRMRWAAREPSPRLDGLSLERLEGRVLARARRAIDGAPAIDWARRCDCCPCIASPSTRQPSPGTVGGRADDDCHSSAICFAIYKQLGLALDAPRAGAIALRARPHCALVSDQARCSRQSHLCVACLAAWAALRSGPTEHRARETLRPDPSCCCARPTGL